MSGDRMVVARQSLKAALNALPSGSTFNIVSFGSTFRRMYAESVKADPQAIEVRTLCCCCC